MKKRMRVRNRLKGLTIICALLVVSSAAGAASDALLPNGKAFPFWERPEQYSRTFFVDAKSGSDQNPGTQALPFQTINKAAQILQPGERVVIAAGIYREHVDPARGGTGPDKMIGYEAAPGANVVVSGAAIVSDWEPSADYRSFGGQGSTPIWEDDLNGGLFGGYNPFGLLDIPQQKAFLVTLGNHPSGDNVGFNRYTMPWSRTHLNLSTYLRHRGLVFVDGKPLSQVDTYGELGQPDTARAPRTQPVGTRPVNPAIIETPDTHLFDEIGGSAGRVWAANNGMALEIRLKNDESPKGHQIEVTTQESVFRPSRRGIAYIHIKGITFEYAGNGFPMPQHGMVSLNRGNHWIIEGNTFEWANSICLDIGNEAWDASMPREAVGYDVIRGNKFRYCGIEGIGGSGQPGGIHNVLVEKNLFEWIGWQGDAVGMSESAAMKLHDSKDLLFRDNVIRHIRNANGVWLDTTNDNNRLTGNIFADIPGEVNPQAIDIEGSIKVNEIDNNIFASLTGAIMIRDTDNLIVANNLFLDCRVCLTETNGLGAPRLVSGHTALGWNDRVYNNVFVRAGQSAIEFTSAKNHADGNVYGEMPRRGGYLRILGPTQWDIPTQAEDWLDLASWQEEYGMDKNGILADVKASFDPDTLQLTYSLPSNVAKVATFDGTNTDYLGVSTGSKRLPGPFSELQGGFQMKNIDPRH